MPAGDKTGPTGQGSRTGRALGYCTGNNMPGYANESSNLYGRGLGRGMGRGRGSGFSFFGRRFAGRRAYRRYADEDNNSGNSREDEIRYLREKADELKQSQKEIDERLNQLGKK
jgi:hypothetical protein